MPALPTLWPEDEVSAEEGEPSGARVLEAALEAVRRLAEGFGDG